MTEEPDMRTCPKCSRVVGSSAECPFCGLVLSKYAERLTQSAQQDQRAASSKLWISAAAISAIASILCAAQIHLSTVMCVCGSCGLVYSPRLISAQVACLTLLITPFVGVRRKVSSDAVLPLLAATLLWLLFVGPAMWGYAAAIVDGSDYFDILLVIPAGLLATSTVLLTLLARRSFKPRTHVSAPN